MIWHDGPQMAKKIMRALNAPHAKPLHDLVLEFLFWANFDSELECKSIRGGPNTLKWWYPDGFTFYTHGDPYAKRPAVEIKLSSWLGKHPIVYTIQDAKDARYFWTVWVPEQRRQLRIAGKAAA